MNEDDSSAGKLIERYWEGLLEAEPMLGTAIGDERFDDRLPDPGPAGRARRERLHRGALEELGSFEIGPLYASVYPAVQNLILAARSQGLGTVLTTVWWSRQH